MKRHACGPGFAGMTFMVLTTLSAGERVTEVQFKLFRGYTIVAQGAMGGRGKLNFLIDTGSVPSVVDHRIARKLHLVGKVESLSVFSGNLRAQRVSVPEVQLGPTRAASLEMLVGDLGFIERELGVRIDAMIGLDLLSQSSFSIDYERKTISFGSSQPLETVVTFTPGLPYAVVDVRAQGQLLRLMVDTGAKDLILFEPRVRGRLPALRLVGSKTSANMHGAVSLRRVELEEARMGQTNLGNLNAYIMDVAADPEFDGLLGIASLGVKRVSFDFVRNTLSWSR